MAGGWSRRSLSYYWRTNLAVVLGVATAVAVLAGALLVGDSVRGSLRDLVLQRLGRADRIVVSTGFFREALADDVRDGRGFAASFASVVPLIVVQGLVSDQSSGRRVSRVAVYGVDERFWRFQGLAGSSPAGPGPDVGGVLLSRALAADLGAAAGGTVLVRVERPSAIPIESLHGRKDDRGRTLRLTVRAVLGAADSGEFSLRPQQGPVRAVFVSLKRLQQELDLDGRVNTLLVADRPGPVEAAGPALREIVRRRAALEDVGLTVRALDSAGRARARKPAGLLDRRGPPPAIVPPRRVACRREPVLTYLANALRSGDREVPYSLVTAIDLASIAPNVTLPRSSSAPVRRRSSSTTGRRAILA